MLIYLKKCIYLKQNLWPVIVIAVTNLFEICSWCRYNTSWFSYWTPLQCPSRQVLQVYRRHVMSGGMDATVTCWELSTERLPLGLIIFETSFLDVFGHILILSCCFLISKLIFGSFGKFDPFNQNPSGLKPSFRSWSARSRSWAFCSIPTASSPRRIDRSWHSTSTSDVWRMTCGRHGKRGILWRCWDLILNQYMSKINISSSVFQSLKFGDVWRLKTCLIFFGETQVWKPDPFERSDRNCLFQVRGDLPDAVVPLLLHLAFVSGAGDG